MDKLLLLYPTDNVLIVRQSIAAGEQISVNGIPVRYDDAIGLGHKVAAKNIEPGEAILKYGVHIGSATAYIPAGAHIHLHNMKSDYITTYTLEKEFEHES